MPHLFTPVDLQERIEKFDMEGGFTRWNWPHNGMVALQLFPALPISSLDHYQFVMAFFIFVLTMQNQ